jgi:hypothetical protein
MLLTVFVHRVGCGMVLTKRNYGRIFAKIIDFKVPSVKRGRS